MGGGNVGRPSRQSRLTEVPRSVYRVGVCRSTDPDPVGRPTPPESVDRLPEAGIPKSPRGSGDRPQKVARLSGQVMALHNSNR